ncbi:DUF3291 domain-containing protein [Pseudooctadecabacter jejudonensis]|uniref:DUF3291 domain-containing protein n=1 Tax=Pseudooctadecabacter jejudonensis TaxID=1391910 RepID=A0A1Y5T8W1_9RHOB|nr:DUF3291 domain-containing protein [Pseudooctadecabacter jejudonensis]SLN58396.1 hypothetical protein PSJ8397_03071 [Pseudooctadecabacter jejudonensis]
MHLAELNIGRLLAPTDDPKVADFMDNLDRINGMGKRMPGFVWMSEGSGEPGTGNTENNIGDDPQLVFNLTVWEDLKSLESFVYKTLHAKFMDRKAEWFEALDQRHFVMWWIPEGHRPSRDEALAKLDQLRTLGPTPDAFDWDFMRAGHAPDPTA